MNEVQSLMKWKEINSICRLKFKYTGFMTSALLLTPENSLERQCHKAHYNLEECRFSYYISHISENYLLLLSVLHYYFNFVQAIVMFILIYIYLLTS